MLPLILAGCAPAPSTDNFGASFPQWVPRDVRLFVIDAQACIHFSGEGPIGEPDRDAFLRRMVRKTCTDLDERKAALSRRYEQPPRVRTIISEAWDQ